MSSNRNKKIIVTVLSTLFLFVSVGIGVLLQNREQRTGISAAGANLSFSINTLTPKVNDTIILGVIMDTNGYSVTGADINVNYDPNYFEGIRITPGSMLPYVFIDGTIANGAANIVLGCPIDSSGPHPVTGTGLVAQIALRVKKSGTTQISFDAKTKISVSGQTINMAGNLTPLETTILNPSPVPTPTGTPAPSFCGGIQGILCPPGLVCVYANGSTRPPYPDASGTCRVGPGLPTITPTPSSQPTATPIPTDSPLPAYCNEPFQIDFSPQLNYGFPGETARYGIKITNIHSVECGAYTTHLIVDKPSNWEAAFGVNTFTLDPDSSFETYLDITSPTSNYIPGENPFAIRISTEEVGYMGHSNLFYHLIKHGDVNRDGIVNIVDIGLIIDNYDMTPIPDPRTDLNNDGIANIVDIGIVIDYYGM